MEHHADGTPHFHIVLLWDASVHFRDARAKFLIRTGDGDDAPVVTDAICLRKRMDRQPFADFLEKTQAYCVKDCGPNVLGERIKVHVGQNRSRQAAYADILDLATRDPDAAEARLKDINAHEFMTKFSQINSFLNAARRKLAVVRLVPNFVVRPWVLPPELQAWYDLYFTYDGAAKPFEGRPRPLIIVGLAGTGKSEWATHFGDPVHMRGRLNLSLFRPEATHVVVDDVFVKSFPCWKDVIGGQRYFNATDKYLPAVAVQHGKPTIWICNRASDPFKYKPFRDYLGEFGYTKVDVSRPLYEADNWKPPIKTVDGHAGLRRANTEGVRPIYLT
jgi:hypothetical protein